MSGCSDRPRLPSGLRLAKSSDAPGILSWDDVRERLWHVTESGNVEQLDLYWQMLADDPRAFSVDSSVNSSDETCLHIAVRKGHVECIKFLLQRHANVNVTGKKGIAAVHLGAARGDVRILEMLVKAGADITLLDTGNTTTLYYAAKHGRTECVRYLLSEHSKMSHSGAMRRYVDVACKSYGWETPLWAAAREGHSEIVKMLVEGGCHIEQCDGNGWTLLHKACKQGNVEVIKTVMKLRPSTVKQMVKSSALDGSYPIHIACTHASVEVISYLILHGSPIDEFNKKGQTPLMVCCDGGRFQYVQALLDAGADPNKSDAHRRTALHLAIERRDLQRTWLLLQFGADQRMPKDGLSRTPRQIAQRLKRRMTRQSRQDNTENDRGYANAGGFVSPGDVACIQELMESLDFFDGRLRTLSELCRVRVRQLLGPSRIDKIEDLPLPPSVKLYLKNMLYRSPPENK